MVCANICTIAFDLELIAAADPGTGSMLDLKRLSVIVNIIQQTKFSLGSFTS